MSSPVGQPQDSCADAMREMQQVNALLTNLHQEVETEFKAASPSSGILTWWRGRGVGIPAKLQEITAKANAAMQSVRAAINTTSDASKITGLKSAFDGMKGRLKISLDEVATIAPDFNKANWQATRMNFNTAKTTFNETLTTKLYVESS